MAHANKARLLHLETSVSIREASLRPAPLSLPFSNKEWGTDRRRGRKYLPPDLGIVCMKTAMVKHKRGWDLGGQSFEVGMSSRCHHGLHTPSCHKGGFRGFAMCTGDVLVTVPTIISSSLPCGLLQITKPR